MNPDIPPVTFGETRSLGELVPAPYNPRKMSPAERAKLSASIAANGFVEPVVIRPEDNLVVGGHQRCDAYRELLRGRGMTEEAIAAVRVPVAVLPPGQTDQQIQMLNLALNKIQGEWDFGKLNALLADLSVKVDPPTLELTGFSTLEVKDLLALTGAAAAPLGGGGRDSEDDDTPPPTADTPEGAAPPPAPSLTLQVEFASAEDAAEARAALTAHGMDATPASSGAALLSLVRALSAPPPADGKAKRARR